jgi:DNA-binding HxlR family transcriptional regulator
MNPTSLAVLPCPVARTLDVIGEWWTLLIIRDAFLGARAGSTTSRRRGSPSERQAYQERPVRYEYLLTEKGQALLPVITALRDWGQEWTAGPDRTPRLAHRVCGHNVALQLYC